jgi:hypothetical protein
MKKLTEVFFVDLLSRKNDSFCRPFFAEWHDDGAKFFEFRLSNGDEVSPESESAEWLLVSIRHGQDSCDNWENTHGFFSGSWKKVAEHEGLISPLHAVRHLEDAVEKAEAKIVNLKRGR